MLIAIAVFKLCKAALLIAVAIGLQRLVGRDVQATLEHWARAVRGDPNDRLIHGIVSRVTGLGPEKLKAIGVGLAFYAALFVAEGVGLLMRKRWAEYLTVISTALLLPVEIWEVCHRANVSRVLVLIANVAIVGYLVVQLWRTREAAVHP